MSTEYSKKEIENIRKVQELFAEGHRSRWIAKTLELDRQLIMQFNKIVLPSVEQSGSSARTQLPRHTPKLN
ncbi:MAG: hypothetical protein EOO52_13320 [Gammaproteobacteria bacterium]|nr:MAG: hypothetical protein EOO52_13320 [Gammaproteobacteria bacterium]